ncbi:hypothetical protein Pcinc_015678 [Petrolisthes cinctipes]|uniref:Uncharacterized protein n=1 Tax=Petrolisthes cinctipes TaxID=88211 RepID=A0AAE1FSK1_PETCI|nr:hypothetical protein Pcinc_015678 [Petrolisthes cinctipes]
MSDRYKRNLEESGMLQVELRPPVESEIHSRRRRDALEDAAGGAAASEEMDRPMYKRSVEWDTRGHMLDGGGLGEFSTMKKRR